MSASVIKNALLLPIQKFAKLNELDLMLNIDEQSLNQKINILAMGNFIEFSIKILDESKDYMREIINGDLIDRIIDNIEKYKSNPSEYKTYSDEYMRKMIDEENLDENKLSMTRMYPIAVRDFKYTLKDMLPDNVFEWNKNKVDFTDDMNKAEFQMGEEVGAKITMAIKHGMMDFIRGLSKAVSDNKVASKNGNYLMFFDMQEAMVVVGESNPASISKFNSTILSSIVEPLPDDKRIDMAMQLVAAMIPPLCKEIGGDRSVIDSFPTILTNFFDSYEKSEQLSEKDDINTND